MDATTMRAAFKYYKSRNPRPDLSTLLEVETGQEGVIQLTPQLHSPAPPRCHCLGLTPSRQWRVFALQQHPGLLVIRNPFTPSGQRLWMCKCLMEYPDPPSVNNISNMKMKSDLNVSSDAVVSEASKRDELIDSPSEMLKNVPNYNNHLMGMDKKIDANTIPSSKVARGIRNNGSPCSCSGSATETCKNTSECCDNTPTESLKELQCCRTPSWWQDVQESGGVESLYCRALRWATLGYHHDWDTKHYRRSHHCPVPPCLATLSTVLARGLALYVTDGQDGDSARRGVDGGEHSVTADNSEGGPQSSMNIADNVVCAKKHLANHVFDRDMEKSIYEEKIYSNSKLFPLLDHVLPSCGSDVSASRKAATDIHSLIEITKKRLYDFRSEAVIVNYYHPKTSLSPHTDHSEPNRDAPLFSISFGQPCVFLIGGNTAATATSVQATAPLTSASAQPLFLSPVTALALHSGDVVLMGGSSRLALHAVPLVATREEWQAMGGRGEECRRPWESNGGNMDEDPNDRDGPDDENIAECCSDACNDGERRSCTRHLLIKGQPVKSYNWDQVNKYAVKNRININIRQVCPAGTDYI